MVASIENQPGKQGSLAVYQYLKQCFDTLDATAVEHGAWSYSRNTRRMRATARARIRMSTAYLRSPLALLH